MCLFRQEGNRDLVFGCFQQESTLGLEGRSRSRHRVSEGQKPARSPQSSERHSRTTLSVLPVSPPNPDSVVCTSLSSMSWTSSANAPLNLTPPEVTIPRSPLQSVQLLSADPVNLTLERWAHGLALQCLPPMCTPFCFDSACLHLSCSLPPRPGRQPLPLHPESRRHLAFPFLSLLTSCGWGPCSPHL